MERDPIGHIFFTRRAGTIPGDWCRAKGLSPHPISGLEVFMASLRKVSPVRADQLAMGVDYPAEDPLDLKVLEGFLENLRAHSGNWYYAPRPNEYLPVAKASLIGMNPMALPPRSLDALRILHGLAVRILSNPVLPEEMRKALRNWGQRIWTNRFLRVPDPGPMTEGAIRPPVQTPAALRAWPWDWQPWKAEPAAMRRDLLDRVESFFPHPRGLHVILLNQCNLQCIMCPYHSSRYRSHHTHDFFQKKRSMKEEIFVKIVEYAGQHRIPIQLGQIEEPLLHLQCFQYIRMAKRAGVPHIHLSTNGTLLDASRAEELGGSGVDSVMFSIDAAMPHTYRKIRGRDLEEVERKVRFFLPLAKRKGIRVTASFIMQPEGEGEREGFLEKWRAMGVDQITYYVLTAHHPDTGAMIRKKEHYLKGERYPCAAPWEQAVVFPEGEISLCCKTMTDVGWRGIVAVGDLREESFAEIWRGERYQTVRRELLGNAFPGFPVCADCQIWSASSYIQEKHPTYNRTYNETMETIAFV